MTECKNETFENMIVWLELIFCLIWCLKIIALEVDSGSHIYNPLSCQDSKKKTDFLL